MWCVPTLEATQRNTSLLSQPLPANVMASCWSVFVVSFGCVGALSCCSTDDQCCLLSWLRLSKSTPCTALYRSWNRPSCGGSNSHDCQSTQHNNRSLGPSQSRAIAASGDRSSLGPSQQPPQAITAASPGHRISLLRPSQQPEAITARGLGREWLDGGPCAASAGPSGYLRHVEVRTVVSACRQKR